MSTTLATLAGLQESIVADSTAMFRIASDLFNAVYTESAGGANTVNFSSREVPAAASIQGTELTDVSPTAVTISQVTAALGTWPVLAQISKIALAAPNASMKIAEALAGGIARAIDSQITALFDDFNTSVVVSGLSDLTVEDFFMASATLDASGFIGQKVAVLHPITFAKIGSSLLTASSSKQEEFLGRGYIATVGGVQIFVSPWVAVDTGFAENAIFFKEALGLGYREPVIDIESLPNLGKVGVDVLGTAFFVTKLLTNNAGILFKTKNS